MSDLISRQKAIFKIMSEPMNEARYPSWYAKKIEELPSEDAVVVVRCKDCRHSSIEGDTTRFMWCEYLNKPTDEKRYCSDGEKVTE